MASEVQMATYETYDRLVGSLNVTTFQVCLSRVQDIASNKFLRYDRMRDDYVGNARVNRQAQDSHSSTSTIYPIQAYSCGPTSLRYHDSRERGLRISEAPGKLQQ